MFEPRDGGKFRQEREMKRDREGREKERSRGATCGRVSRCCCWAMGEVDRKEALLKEAGGYGGEGKLKPELERKEGKGREGKETQAAEMGKGGDGAENHRERLFLLLLLLLPSSSFFLLRLLLLLLLCISSLYTWTAAYTYTYPSPYRLPHIRTCTSMRINRRNTNDKNSGPIF
jgi:hypothetical protein